MTQLRRDEEVTLGELGKICKMHDVDYGDIMEYVKEQFFIPIISLLRNAALNSLKFRQELELAKHQVDILNFEENMNALKEGFVCNYRFASERINTAIDEIDQTILHLQKTFDEIKKEDVTG